MQTIEWVDHIDIHDEKGVGTKAVNLGRLARGEFLIPPTFVITHHALENFLKEDDRSHLIRKVLQGADPEDGQGLARRAEAIADLFNKESLPWNVEIDIINAYRRLCREVGTKDAPVAVRCSTRLEMETDTKPSSIFQARLNIKGEGALLDAVKSQWASLFSPPMISYLQGHGRSKHEFTLGVIVQGMAIPDVSGTMLTWDPNLEGDLLTIKAVYGHPISMEREEIVPDVYIIDRESDNFWDKQLSNQGWKYVIDERGAPAKEDVDRYTQSFQKLFNEQVLQLSRLGTRCEKLFNSPLAIEWCMQSNDLYILDVKKMASGTWASDVPTNAAKQGTKEEVFASKEIAEGEEGAGEPVVGFGAFFGGIDEKTSDEKEKEEEISPFLHLPSTRPEEAADKGPEMRMELGGSTGTDVHNGLRLLFIDVEDPREVKGLARTSVSGVCSLSMDELFRRSIGIHPLEVIEQGIERDVLGELVDTILDVASVFHPRPVFIKTSEGTSSDFQELKGGSRFEPKEPNPILGLRGGMRYLNRDFSKAFEMELGAIKIARREMDEPNIGMVLPLMRTPEELASVLRVSNDIGLEPQGSPGVLVAASLPVHALRTKEFLSGVTGICVDMEQLFLSCYGYDPMASRFGIQVPPWEALPSIDPLLERMVNDIRGSGAQLLACNLSSMIGPKLIRNLASKGFHGLCAAPKDMERIQKLMDDVRFQK